MLQDYCSYAFLWFSGVMLWNKTDGPPDKQGGCYFGLQQIEKVKNRYSIMFKKHRESVTKSECFSLLFHPGSPGKRAVKRVCVCVFHPHCLIQGSDIKAIVDIVFCPRPMLTGHFEYILFHVTYS